MKYLQDEKVIRKVLEYADAFLRNHNISAYTHNEIKRSLSSGVADIYNFDIAQILDLMGILETKDNIFRNISFVMKDTLKEERVNVISDFYPSLAKQIALFKKSQANKKVLAYSKEMLRYKDSGRLLVPMVPNLVVIPDDFSKKYASFGDIAVAVSDNFIDANRKLKLFAALDTDFLLGLVNTADDSSWIDTLISDAYDYYPEMEKPLAAYLPNGTVSPVLRYVKKDR